MSIIERAVKRLKTAEILRPAGMRHAVPTPRPVSPPAPRVAPEAPLPPLPPPPITRAPTAPPPAPAVRVEKLFDTIDLARLESLGMILPDGKRTQISEEFRVIKRRLLQNLKQTGPAKSRKGNLILVTSAFPNEGKTFSAINLAISLSLELDHSVLLVDADVAQAQRGQFLGLKPREGLMDLLLEPERSLESTIIRTNIDRLDVLLAGRPHQQATELLASENMTRLLNQLSAQGPDRIVVFDAPPLLVTTEAGTLAHRAGQIVMVVEAGKTAQTALKSALAQLEGCTVFGLLNKSTGSLGQDVFDYGRYRYSE